MRSRRRPAERTTRPRRLRLATALLAAALAGAATACRGALPVLGAVPPFTLTERAGTPLGTRDLAGHVWVADFIFTRCPDFCPALTARMKGLQDVLAAPEDAVRLVSITVDPEHDTPEVLRDYATRNGARPGWLFLTGPREHIASLLRDGFRVAYASDGPPESPITHSDRFVLVDRQLRIRGYYHGTDEHDLGRLARDAAALRAERPS